MTADRENSAKVLVITGPTAIGKSEIATRTALRLGKCEIISADSMQVYREMDVGTAKPAPELRAAVPHHLLDILDPREDFSVAEFQALARCRMSEIADRGRLPILVGGSGLYVRAAIDPLDFSSEPPGSDRRRELEELGQRDERALIELLGAVDPGALNHIDLGNRRRIIRAIETFEATGQSFATSHRQWNERRSIYDVLMIGLTMTRGKIIDRIEARVDDMLASGLIDEVRSLTAGERPLSESAAQALGYKELLAYLRGGQTKAEAVELIKVRTRQFAKRQMTWFRADPRINWVEIGDEDHEIVVNQILALVKKKRFIVS